MKDGSLVHVVWIDSCATGGWNTKKGLASATICESVGWLASSTKETITVAGHKSDATGEWNGAMTIPRVAVRKLRGLSSLKGKVR